MEFSVADEAVDLGLDPVQVKAAEVLRRLCEELEKTDSSGEATIEGVSAHDYRVLVMVFVDKLDEDLRTKLADAGFVLKAEAQPGRVLVGRLDLRRLEALASLEEVKRIMPVRR